MKRIYEEPSVLIVELMSTDILLASGDVDLDSDLLTQSFELKAENSANSGRFGSK